MISPNVEAGPRILSGSCFFRFQFSTKAEGGRSFRTLALSHVDLEDLADQDVRLP